MKEDMSIKKIKEKMIEWTDFYGGDISASDEISEAKSKSELKEILNKHETFMEDMLCDAKSHLEKFKEEIGLKYC